LFILAGCGSAIQPEWVLVSGEASFAELISKVAHELRSPLTAVQGFSGTLVKRWDRFSEEQRLQLVETIYADAQRMSRIISEVLDLARMESGHLELGLGSVNLATLAERTRKSVARLPGAERFEVEIDEAVEVWADETRLEHVLNNLVENGIKFSDDGPVVLSARSAQDGMVEVSVSDHGIGIEPERLEQVFSSPAPSGQRSAPSGTGLGLYLAKRLVAAHGGSMSVVSEPEVGSTFSITLPAPEQRS
jgi:signal transduction histidine kinase